jgi:hypothetical protein
VNTPESFVVAVSESTSTPFLLKDTVISLSALATEPDFTLPDTEITGFLEMNVLLLVTLATMLDVLPTTNALDMVTSAVFEQYVPILLVVSVYLPAVLGVAMVNTPVVRSALAVTDTGLTPVFSCTHETVTVQPALTRETLIDSASPGAKEVALEVLSIGARKVHFAYKVIFEATPGS